MELGSWYRLKSGLGKFPFGEEIGKFVGYSANNWPMFEHLTNGRQSCLNATDNNFELHITEGTVEANKTK